MMMRAAKEKIMTLGEVKECFDALKRAGKRTVTTNGVFDIVHVGHVRYLEEARQKGDVLAVGVNADASVKMNKGTGRPIVPCAERMEVLAALESVDCVFPFDEKTPAAWIVVLKPDVHVKGGDYAHASMAEERVVREYGGAVFIAGKAEGKSTTALIEKIRRAI